MAAPGAGMVRPGLAEEVAQTVVQGIGIDQRLEAATKDLERRGRRALRELQAQQRDRDEVLTQEMHRHLEHQRKLREDHTKLKDATTDLVRWLLPWSPGLHGALDGVAGAAAGCEATGPTARPRPPAVEQEDANISGGTYSISLRKADGLGLGLEVSLWEEGRSLLVERIEPGSVVEAWNRRCHADGNCHKVVCPHDIIVAVNSAQGATAMLKEFESQWLLRLTLVHGQGVVPLAPPEPAAGQFSAGLRPDAPEFLPEPPRAPEPAPRAPLQPRQLPVIHEDASETEPECGPLAPKKVPVRMWFGENAPDAGFRDKENRY